MPAIYGASEKLPTTAVQRRRSPELSDDSVWSVEARFTNIRTSSSPLLAPYFPIDSSTHLAVLRQLPLHLRFHLAEIIETSDPPHTATACRLPLPEAFRIVENHDPLRTSSSRVSDGSSNGGFNPGVTVAPRSCDGMQVKYLAIA
jgi:hypothetical protein